MIVAVKREAAAAVRFALGAAVGIGLVSPGAAIVIDHSHDFRTVNATIGLLALLIMLLPIVSWIVLWAIGIRPSWLAAGVGCALTLITVNLVESYAHRAVLSAWAYGACAAVLYGATAAFCSLRWLPGRDPALDHAR